MRLRPKSKPPPRRFIRRSNEPIGSSSGKFRTKRGNSSGSVEVLAALPCRQDGLRANGLPNDDDLETPTMTAIRSKLTYANVLSTLCLFLLMGGGAAFAASKLAKNSVGTKQIKNSAVTAAKIKKGSITGAEVKNGSLTGTQINPSTLGTVPTAQTASTAGTATNISPPEGWHEVGAAGQPAFEHSWHNVTTGTVHPETLGFYKDHEGIVHLKGAVTGGAEGQIIFALPPGFRPANGHFIRVPVACENGTGCPSDTVANSPIVGPNVLPGDDGAVFGPNNTSTVYFDGVTFRAES